MPTTRPLDGQDDPGLASAVAAWYVSFAAVPNLTFGRGVVPVRPLRLACCGSGVCSAGGDIPRCRARQWVAMVAAPSLEEAGDDTIHVLGRHCRRLPAGGWGHGSRTGGGGLRGADRGSLARGGLLLPASEVHRPGERKRPGHLRAVRRGALPRVLQGIRGSARLGHLLAHDAGQQQPAVLEVVRWRPTERLLQLHRPPPGDQSQPGSADLGARAGGEDTKAITYQELYKRVNEFAALLGDHCGVKVGDRVTFHLPMVPELPVSMLACARLGVIHSEVFGGFSG